MSPRPLVPSGATFIGLRSAAQMAFDQCAWHPRGGSRYRFSGAVLEVRVGGVRCAGARPDRGRDRPETAISALAPGLLAGARAALVLEAPMLVPVPDGRPGAWRRLGKARDGEGNRPWSARAGASAQATGLAQGAWMLRQLAITAPGLAATTRPESWQRGARPTWMIGSKGPGLPGRPPRQRHRTRRRHPGAGGHLGHRTAPHPASGPRRNTSRQLADQHPPLPLNFRHPQARARQCQIRMAQDTRRTWAWANRQEWRRGRPHDRGL